MSKTPQIVNVPLVTEGIKVDGKPVTSVDLIKPKAGQLRGLANAQLLVMDTNELMKLLPRITKPSLAAAQLDELEADDFMVLAKEAVTFMTGSRMAVI